MTAPAIPEGFTPHDGNGCPVIGLVVNVLFSDGVVCACYRDPAGYRSQDEFDWWNWADNYVPTADRIIAYKVIKP